MGTTDLGSQLDSILSDAPESNTGASETPETSNTAAPGGQDLPAEPAEGNAPGAGDQPAEEEQEWADEERDKLPADQTGKNRIVSKNRFDALYQRYRATKEIEKALGYMPNAEELQNFSAAAADFELMEADVVSGDPDRVGKFVDHWTGKAPEALPAIIDHAVAKLKTSDPETYAGFQSVIAGEVMNGLYSKVASMRQSSSPEDFAKNLHAVQMVDWLLNQNYREATELDMPQSQEDPRDRRLAELEQEKAQREQATRVDSTRAFNQGIANELTTARASAVDESLARIAPSFETRPRMFSAIKESLAKAAVEEMKADSLFQARFTAARDRAFRSGKQEDAAALAKLYRERFTRGVRNHRDAVIREVTSQVTEQNKATHSALGRQAEKREPGGAASPSNPISGDRFKDAIKGKKFDDAFAALGLD